MLNLSYFFGSFNERDLFSLSFAVTKLKFRRFFFKAGP